MSQKMNIDAALAELQASKLSHQISEAIKDRIATLESELEDLRGRHESAAHSLRLQQFANLRLEGESRKLNAQIYTLLRANLLTEKFYTVMTLVAVKIREYVEISLRFSGAILARVIADIKSGKARSHIVVVAATIYALLKELTPTESSLREMAIQAHRTGKYLVEVKKRVGVQFEKASAYLAALHKTAA